MRERSAEWVARRGPLFWACLAVLLVACWQWLTVQANYGGNWTGLFRIGAVMPMPPNWSGELVRSGHPSGYDGQFFLVLAHDPWLREDVAVYLDAPAFRARRILIPALSWMLAAGQHRYITSTYVLLQWASVFLGVYFLGLWMVLAGRPAGLGALFLLVPSTVVAVDSMTVDGTLAALAAVFLWQWAARRQRGLWLTLAACGLIRETGLLLVLTAVLLEVWGRNWRRAGIWAAAAIPSLLWFLYVAARLPDATGGGSVPRWLVRHLDLGICSAFWPPLPYETLPAWQRVAVQVLDFGAVTGMAALFLQGIRWVLWMGGGPRPMQLLSGIHIAFALLGLNSSYWKVAYGYTRLFGPLFVSGLCAASSSRQQRAMVGLLLLVDLRLWAEYARQVSGVVSWVTTQIRVFLYVFSD